MTTETANKLVETIATLFDIAGCPPNELLNKWKEKPNAETLYKVIEDEEYTIISRFAGHEVRYLFHAAYRIADTIAIAETY